MTLDKVIEDTGRLFGSSNTQTIREGMKGRDVLRGSSRTCKGRGRDLRP